MTPHTLEPGLLHVFRLFALFEVLLNGSATALRWLNPTMDNSIPELPIVGLLVFAGMFFYLHSAWLHQRLGKFYLPIGIAMTYGGMLVWWIARIPNRVSRFGYLQGVNSDLTQIIGEIMPDIWHFILLMAMLSLIIGWQYNFRWVLGFNLFAASLVSISLSFVVPLESFAVTLLVWFLGTTHAIYLGIGYIVSRVIHEQRKQRSALEIANRQLVAHASTLEELAVSRERNRMALELHDTMAHTLTAVSLQLEAAKILLDRNPQAIHAKIEQINKIVHEGLLETRRTLHDLRAKPLDDLGLGLALRELASQSASRGGIALQDRIDLTIQLPRPLEQAIYRIAEESITNTLRHANARCIQVGLIAQQADLLLTIQDDGDGFSVQGLAGDSHYGLQGMQERAQMIGAQLTIDSTPGQGTTVRLWMKGLLA
jgi:signal transduction histidine kinase